MKKNFFWMAVTAVVLVACEQGDKDTENLTNHPEALPVTKDTLVGMHSGSPLASSFTAEQAAQIRSIVYDEVAKAVGSMRLEAGAFGLPLVTTVFDSAFAAQYVAIDSENSRNYWNQVVKLGNLISEDEGHGIPILDGTHKIRYQGQDYAIIIRPAEYVLELGHNVSTLIVEVFERDRVVETLSLSIDETTSMKNPEPVYKGRLNYRFYDEGGKTSSSVSNYGTCAARLSEFIEFVPVLLKAGKLVEV